MGLNRTTRKILVLMALHSTFAILRLPESQTTTLLQKQSVDLHVHRISLQVLRYCNKILHTQTESGSRVLFYQDLAPYFLESILSTAYYIGSLLSIAGFLQYFRRLSRLSDAQLLCWPIDWSVAFLLVNTYTGHSWNLPLGLIPSHIGIPVRLPSDKMQINTISSQPPASVCSLSYELWLLPCGSGDRVRGKQNFSERHISL